MRRFHSYGPVDCEEHFCVERKELVNHCVEQLIGNPEKGGHYFTVWAPRQTGKTWLVRQAKKEIERRYPDRFRIGLMSMQGVVLKNTDSDEEILSWMPNLLRDSLNVKVDAPKDWMSWINFFHREDGLFDKPLILFVDEFDSLPRNAIDRLTTIFRDMYLKRESYILHGLALIGVRAVLGVESERGSPFNIQRSLHVPNFARDEVEDLFRQYREESGQEVEPAVVRSVYDATRGQPGLVGWFGELLTETYNPGADRPIDMEVWSDTYRLASVKHWNNTILNLVKKAKGEYLERVLELFTRSDIPFTIDSQWCGYLYLHGIIDSETIVDSQGNKTEICRFANPFIQRRLYNALTLDLVGDRTPILAVEPLDKMEDVFDKTELDLPALLERYKNYLKRLKAKGIDPWREQPGRTDMHFTEAVGHFHLYAWLKEAAEDICVVSPEFPAGNGRVDIHLKCAGKAGIIEVKSFKSMVKTESAKRQAAEYASRLGLSATCIALFVPVEDESVLKALSGETAIDGVKVFVSAIGWV